MVKSVTVKHEANVLLSNARNNSADAPQTPGEPFLLTQLCKNASEDSIVVAVLAEGDVVLADFGTRHRAAGRRGARARAAANAACKRYRLRAPECVGGCETIAQVCLVAK